MQVKLLQECHPDYDGEYLSKLDALYEGGKAFHAHKRGLLPKAAAEPMGLYQERLSRATYANHTAPILNFFGAYLFSESPRVSGLEDYAGFEDDVDRKGSSWTSFWREAFIEALRRRTAWVWVNLPARSEDEVIETRLDEERSGALDAFLTLLPDVHSWEEGADGRLLWVMCRSQSTERADPTQPRIPVWRWTLIDGSQIRRWEWRGEELGEEPKDEDDATELDVVEHNFGELPVVRLEMPKGLWLGEKIYDPAVSAFQGRCDLDWGLYRGAHALLTITGRWEAKASPTVGPGYWLQLTRDKDGSDEAKYVEPSGATLKLLIEDLRERRQELYRVTQQMALAADAQSQHIAQSGESKKRDYQATEVVLAAYADVVLAAMNAAADLVAIARDIKPETVKVSGLDGWQSLSLDEFLNASALASEAKRLSPAFVKVLARRQVERILGRDLTADELEIIQREIDESDPNALPGFGPGIGLPDDDPDDGEDEDEEP